MEKIGKRLHNRNVSEKDLKTLSDDPISRCFTFSRQKLYNIHNLNIYKRVTIKTEKKRDIIIQQQTNNNTI